MTTNKLLLLVLTICGGFMQSFSQNAPFEQSIKDISSQIKSAKTADASTEQKMKLIKDNIVSLEYTKTDTKGKVSVQGYQFNMADVNPGGIKEVLDGPIMYVVIPVKGNNKYIETSRDGKFDGYQSSVRIIAYDVDNSRALISAIQKSTSIAEKMELDKFSYTSQDQILAALYAAIKSTPDNTVSQKIKSTADKKEKLDFTSVIAKDGKSTMFEFNLADINPLKINIKISGFLGVFPGKALSVSIETNGGQKVIKEFENDIPKTYVSSFSIAPIDIENAKQIKNLIYLAIQNLKSGTTALSDFSYSGITSSNGAAGTETNNTTGVSGNSNNQSRNNNSNSTSANNDQRNSNAYNQDGNQARNNNNGNSNYNNNNAQQRSNAAGNYPRPDFNNVPCFFNENSQSLQNLERVVPTGLNKATGLWGSEKLYVLHGESSPVRFRQGDKIQFIVALQNERTDPNTECDLNVCTINQKHQQREYVGSKAGMGHAESVSNVVPINFKPLGNGLFLITITGQIPKGELFFSVKGEQVFYAFGID